ncbi:hypothetical protein K8B33_09560 [Alcanivorax sp. JB21]|uniref:hypothetical protein n=1 Tax=Alcanivorax limicola TaxID=2874102 RepID=UPI001CBF14D0|nr:hypothetical protein [Alcanivorax limicola]MBZ2189344.1 hypothetical protein [Alcanivorax limicola]
MKILVQRIAVTFVILMAAACQKHEPDWAQLISAELARQEAHERAPRHARIVGVDQCRATQQGDIASVRCQLEAEMLISRSELEARHGSAAESITVAEMTHRFGDFEKGERKSVPLTAVFMLLDGEWQMQP